ncbi:MAG: hypothetical protein JSU63_07035 [Phycisphaerales bacterium]|nr:MAG: hypothetical protein JSU63_07035 [Phycisphaerales bacterium]
MRPDDFKEKVKRTLAERACYHCCNPDCRELTGGPHSDPSKVLRTGIACHIQGASRGGPRYDQLQTSEERSGIENGIWLCSECAQLIDKDEAAYPPEVLLKWKQDHESWIANKGIIPDLPRISIVTSAGLPVPQEAGVTLDLGRHAHLRRHTLAVSNPNHTSIMQFEGQITLPEPVKAAKISKRPPGVEVVSRPFYPPMQAIGTGKVTRHKAQAITGQWDFGIERLPAQGAIAVEFLTSNGEDAQHYLAQLECRPPVGCGDSEFEQYLSYYFLGRFQYEYRGATLSRDVFAPIAYDKAKRRISILEVRDDFGDWQPLKHTPMS